MQPVIVSVSSAFPSNYYSQQELTAMMREAYWNGSQRNVARFERLQQNVEVEGRHLALPAEAYPDLASFGQSNAAWLRVAIELGEKALACLLGQQGASAAEIALLATTTVTGIAVPTLDARLMNRLPFSARTKRLPLFGLGCLGGVAGIARVADYLKGHPREAAILLAVELCSLTFQPGDLSIANIIATGLFGDGAAAVLLAGPGHRLARGGRAEIVDSRSIFFPDTERVMGWDITETGFQVVLSADVPAIARNHVRPAVDAFLAEHDLERADITCWVSHPGGPKVIEGLTEGLELPPDALALSRESLRRVGNISSVSVLLILQATLQRLALEAKGRHKAGPYYGLMMAMGPGFCAELVLLRMQQ